MRAFQLVGWQQPPEPREVPVPDPGPGQVRVEKRVYGPWGCGVCANCREGRENYCQKVSGEGGGLGGGVGLVP
ncbi:hypothetical protein LVX13_21370 [Streptomyces albulus]|uniref:alcohol dehydrogenase catalytic domain-containing protein n=1 Tax=Streptomyces noursei TaxID=1971 RepID=UPI001F2CADF3|nr:alcohol dehydrogenase catalytic domain-containing protein [Streptomyces noursei]MCE4945644.1 hypothetical protein [Streptomyces noursei]